MDPIYYFLKHSFLLHLALAVIACGIGFAAGWWLWARFKSQSEALAQDLAQQKDRALKLTRERDDLMRSKDELQLGLVTAKSDTDKLRLQLAASREETADKISEVQSLQRERDVNAERSFSLEQALALAQTQHGESLAEVGGLNETVVRMEKQLEDAQEELARQKVQFAEREAALSRQADDATKASKAARQEVSQLKGECQALTKEKAEFLTLGKNLETELAELRARFESTEKSTAQQAETRENLQSQLTRLAAELSRSEDQATRVGQERDQLEHRLNEALQQLVIARSVPQPSPGPADWELQQTRYEEEIVRLREKLASIPVKEAHPSRAASVESGNSSAPMLFDLPGN